MNKIKCFFLGHQFWASIVEAGFSYRDLGDGWNTITISSCRNVVIKCDKCGEQHIYFVKEGAK